MRHRPIHFLVIMPRVVVEEEQSFRLGAQGQRHCMVHRTVAPAGMAGVFFGIELRIEDMGVDSAGSDLNALLMDEQITWTRTVKALEAEPLGVQPFWKAWSVLWRTRWQLTQ